MRIVKLLISTVLLVVGSVANAAFTYTDETEYLTVLATMGFAVINEGFEDDTVWADSRTSIISPGSTPSVISQGIEWTSNFATNNIATSNTGVAGTFGLFSSPHGDPNVETDETLCNADPIPEQCFLHDGFVGNSVGAGTLYGVGAWINGTFGAEVTLFLDGVEVGFGADGGISGWTFLGVIDAAGFNSVEFREINGKSIEVLTIRTDDVTFGASAVPVPAAVWLFGSGLLGLVGMARRKKAA